MTDHETLTQLFPMRKTKAQKEAFRQWMLQTAQSLGYSAQVEVNSCLVRCRNVVIGQPEKARVLVTAHYDTAPEMFLPNFITPRNLFVYVLYQVGLLAAMFLISALCSFALYALTHSAGLAALAFIAAYWALLLVMLIGPANKHCANDNTSGVAAVLELMRRLPAQERDKVAFLLFDNEEKGLLGSIGYATAHKGIKKNTLLINLDCVGDGETLLFFTRKKTRRLPEYTQLCAAFAALPERKVAFFPMATSVYPSDQSNFQHGIAVCACRWKRGIGYYCPNLHTRRDTVCAQSNLEDLATGLRAFVEAL